MRRSILVSFIAVLIFGVFVVYLHAGDKGQKMMMKPTTIEGTVVDAKCYLGGVAMGKPAMNFGNDHMVMGHDGSMMKMPNCATACANMGIPAAIVEGGKPGGKTTIIIAPASMFADLMTKTARITGTKTEAGLIAKKVEVKENGKWKEVPIPGMM